MEVWLGIISYANGHILFPLVEKYAKRDVLSKFQKLKAFDLLTVNQQRKIQKDECYNFLAFCRAEVPYYKDLFESISFDIEKIKRDIKYINDLPLLTKQIVKENEQKLRMFGAYNVRKTGGSTGQSVYFYFDGPGLDWTAAINLLAYEMAGKKVHHTDCHISADLEILGLSGKNFKDKFFDWARLFVQNRNRLMISSFSDEDLKSVVANLKKINPYMLQGHPSTAYAIAHYIETYKISPPKIKVFEPTGEMLTDKMVEKIEAVLKCKVTNRYGNAECGVIAHALFDDNYKRLKVFERAFYVEDCHQSPIVVTGFTNKGFPLVRYDTGDIATVATESTGTFIYNIQGRIHDKVKIDGKLYPTHFIMDCLDHKVRGVREFQILLADEELPLLKIVPESEDDQSRITSEVQKVWSRGLNLEFVKFESFQTVGWRQKFRHVVDLRNKKDD